MPIFSNIYRVWILISIFLIWGLVAASKYTSYTLNIAYLLLAIMISLLCIGSIMLTWLTMREAVQQHKRLTVLFLLSSTPISLSLFLILFADSFSILRM